MNKSEIAVIVLNWNGLKLIKPFLESLWKQRGNNFNLVVLDNGSNDGSVEYLKKECKGNKSLHLLLCKKNTGFALGNNIAMSYIKRYLKPKYFVLLNNDTIPEAGFLENIVNKVKEFKKSSKYPFLSKDSWKLGSIAPLIENYYEKGKVDSAGILVYPDGSAINRGVGEKVNKYSGDEEVFGPSGAAVLYLQEALDDVSLPVRKTINITSRGKRIWDVDLGRSRNKKNIPVIEYFSSRHFAYYEDVDLAYRLRLKGWGTIFTPNAKVLHHHSATGKSYSSFKSFHIHRNQYYNIIRNYPSYYLFLGYFRALKRYFLLLGSIKKKKGPAAVLAKNTSKLKVIHLVLKGWLYIKINMFGLLMDRRYIQSRRKISLAQFKEIMDYQGFKASLNKMIFNAPYAKGEQKNIDE